MDKLNLNIKGLTEKDYEYLGNKIRDLVYPIANQLQEKSSMVDSLQAQINSLKKSDEEQKVNNQLLKDNSKMKSSVRELEANNVLLEDTVSKLQERERERLQLERYGGRDRWENRILSDSNKQKYNVSKSMTELMLKNRNITVLPHQVIL